MTVLLDARARQALERESRRRRLMETGGALFGFDDGDNVVVACAYPPGPHARHRRASFEPNRPTTDALMRAVRKDSDRRFRFLGSWHTHPGGAAVPSGRDATTAAEIATDTDVRLPRPLVLIQATRPRPRGANLAELAAWRFDPWAGRLASAAIEAVQLDERWCPVVALPGARRGVLLRG